MRDIRNIEETAAAAGSTFHGSFKDPVGITGFDDDDFSRYQEIFIKNHISLTKETLKNIEAVRGRSPYLLAKIGNFLSENPGSSLGAFFDFSRSLGFVNYYNDLIKILKSENYYEKMIQVFIGPRPDLTEQGVGTLKHLGYITEIHNPPAGKIPLRSISEDFTQYLHEMIIHEDKDL
jgi:hypothetical protein